jgi:two-component system cell cycle sensor histidine kinase/response regulator CckA
MNSDALGNEEQSHTVLLVDDEIMVLEVGKAILERIGHTVITAMSGEEALEKFTQHRHVIGCVVLDLTMPGMDGKEIFERLRALRPDLPIIIASGLSADHILAEFGEMRPTSIIQKPYQIANLSSKIEGIFNGQG